MTRNAKMFNQMLTEQDYVLEFRAFLQDFYIFYANFS